MKGRLAAIILFMFLFAGCSRNNDDLECVLALREKLQTCQECQFTAAVTADYGDEICTFNMDCVMNEQGDVTFSVVEPERISGITGKISHDGGALVFDDQYLAFPMLADDQITPVSAPWILTQTLRGGYIRSCAETDNGRIVIIDDSYHEDSLQLDIWLDETDLPTAAEIIWNGRRVLSLKVSNMVLQ